MELSTQLVQRLLDANSGHAVLEVCRGLWTMQALHEHSRAKRLRNLDNEILKQHETLESALDVRQSAAISSGDGVGDAVRQMNDREMLAFQTDALAQQQNLACELIWDMRRVLYWQQYALSKLAVPGFVDAAATDEYTIHQQSQICAVLHSAFYIRKRMGMAPHLSMLKSQLKKLQEHKQKQQQSPLTTSLPMSRQQVVRLSPLQAGHVPMPQHQPPPPPPHGYYNGAPGMIAAPAYGQGNFQQPVHQQAPVMFQQQQHAISGHDPYYQQQQQYALPPPPPPNQYYPLPPPPPPPPPSQ